MVSLTLFSKSKNSLFLGTSLSCYFRLHLVTLPSQIEPVSERSCFLCLYTKATTIFFLRNMETTRHQMKVRKKWVTETT